MASSTRRSTPRRANGFSLIEVMVVVVIIGILTALAIVRYNVAAMRAAEKEADLILKQIYTLQQTYRADAGGYASTLQELIDVGWYSPGASLKHYQDPPNDISTIAGGEICMEPLVSSTGRRRCIDGSGLLATP